MTPEAIAELVERAKDEIGFDIAVGRVPAEVASFSELHDYVDANCYAGMCEDDSPVYNGGDLDIDAANAVQDEVDRWIRAGRPKGQVPA